MFDLDKLLEVFEEANINYNQWYYGLNELANETVSRGGNRS